MLQVTSPLRCKEQVKKYIDQFVRLNWESAFTVFPIKSACYHVDGSEVNCNSEIRDYNNFGVYPVYKETGSVYIFRRKMLYENHITKGGNLLYDIYDYDINTKEVFLEQLAPIRIVRKEKVTTTDLPIDDQNKYRLSIEHGGYIKQAFLQGLS